MPKPHDCQCTENSTMCSACVINMNMMDRVGQENVLGTPYPHATELKSPKQCMKFMEVIMNMYSVHLDKNCDYSPANIVVMGEIGVLVRIWDKFCRLCNLYGITVPAVAPKIDNLIDEINSKDMSKADIIQRLKYLKRNSKFNFYDVKAKSPKNESVDDAWLDMATYSVIGFLEKLGVWGR